MRGFSSRLLFAVLLVSSITLVSACGKSASPTTPSTAASTANPSTAGATILGSLVGAPNFSKAANSSSAITVSVVGTTITVTIDGSGHFTLTGVPGGDVTLHFHSPSVDATATILAVQATDSFTITVTLTSTTATIDSDSRPGHSEDQIEGAITALPPTTAANSFTVDGVTVQTNSSTDFDTNGVTETFAALKVGDQVHVSGNVISTGFLATKVEIQTPQAEVKGVVSSLSGTAPTLTFKVGTTTVHTNASTRVDNGEDGVDDNQGGNNQGGNDQGGNDQGSGDFSQIVNGATVDVVGITQTDGSILGTHITVTQTNQRDVQGAIAGLTGSCPTLHFTIGSTTITTNGSTKFEDLTCTSLKTGSKVDVHGTTQTDGSVVATSVGQGDDGGQ